MRALPVLGALAASGSFACGSAADAPGPVATRGPGSGGTEAPGPTTASMPDGATELDCPPTRIISDVSDPASTPSGAAVNIMDVWCGACHAADAKEPAAAGPSVATDFNRMIDEGFVIDCDAERSPIVISMRAGEMPPADYFGISPSPAEIEPVVRFIELDCSDEENACAEDPTEPGCDEVVAARRARRCAW